MDNLTRFLTGKIIIGSSAALVLMLAVKTTRPGAIHRFLPVESSSISGFASNAKAQNSKVASLGRKGSNAPPPRHT